jgi:hypothetical protein
VLRAEVPGDLAARDPLSDEPRVAGTASPVRAPAPETAQGDGEIAPRLLEQTVEHPDPFREVALDAPLRVAVATLPLATHVEEPAARVRDLAVLALGLVLDQGEQDHERYLAVEPLEELLRLLQDLFVPAIHDRSPRGRDSSSNDSPVGARPTDTSHEGRGPAERAKKGTEVPAPGLSGHRRSAGLIAGTTFSRFWREQVPDDRHLRPGSDLRIEVGAERNERREGRDEEAGCELVGRGGPRLVRGLVGLVVARGVGRVTAAPAARRTAQRGRALAVREEVLLGREVEMEREDPAQVEGEDQQGRSSRCLEHGAEANASAPEHPPIDQVIHPDDAADEKS